MASSIQQNRKDQSSTWSIHTIFQNSFFAAISLSLPFYQSTLSIIDSSCDKSAKKTIVSHTFLGSFEYIHFHIMTNKKHEISRKRKDRNNMEGGITFYDFFRFSVPASPRRTKQALKPRVPKPETRGNFGTRLTDPRKAVVDRDWPN